MIKYQRKFWVLFLLGVFLAQSLYASYSKNLTFDETYYVSTGYYFLKNADTTMSILQPPLSVLLGGLHSLFFNIREPYSYHECVRVSYIKCMQDFLFKSKNYSETLSFLSRLPFIAISLLLGLAIFFFAEELYGANSALFSLILYSFSPTILGFSHIIFTDMLVTFFIFISIYLMWKLLTQGHNNTVAIASGISLGLALASKFTALLLIPIFLIFVFIAIIRSKNKINSLRRIIPAFILILIIAFLVLYSTYFFSFNTLANSIPERNLHSAESFIKNNVQNPHFRKAIDFLVYDIRIPMPQYWAGLMGQSMVDITKNKEGYLNGKIYEGGRWYYFFEVLLIKTPIPLLIFFLISALFSINHKLKLINSLFLIIPAMLFFGIFILGNFNLGLRHILPIFPLVIVFSSQVANIQVRNPIYSKFFYAFISFLFIWYAASAIWIMPDYAAYFNEIVMGPKNGHQYLLSSNLDQGQDLKGLARYLKKNNIHEIKLSYHGTLDPSYYNISYQPLPMEYYLPWIKDFSPDEPLPGYREDCSKKYGIIAISVSNLHNYHLLNRTCFDWLKPYKPIARIGYTIHIYNLTY